MITLTCHQCGKEYKVYPARSDSKFCSRDCHYKSKKGKPIPWLDEIRKPGVCLNTGRTHIKKGQRLSPETEFKDGEHNGEEFKEGHESWLKGTKGIAKPNKTSFQKGHVPWNKGLKGYNPSPENNFTSEDVRGENNVNWKGGISREYDKIKQSDEYKNWRKSVYEKDWYSCRKCGTKEDIVAHHINSFDEYKEQRFDVENGAVLCRSCHAKFHNQHGFGNNNSDQFDEFME